MAIYVLESLLYEGYGKHHKGIMKFINSLFDKISSLESPEDHQGVDYSDVDDHHFIDFNVNFKGRSFITSDDLPYPFYLRFKYDPHTKNSGKMISVFNTLMIVIYVGHKNEIKYLRYNVNVDYIKKKYSPVLSHEITHLMDYYQNKDKDYYKPNQRHYNSYEDYRLSNEEIFANVQETLTEIEQDIIYFVKDDIKNHISLAQSLKYVSKKYFSPYQFNDIFFSILNKHSDKTIADNPKYRKKARKIAAKELPNFKSRILKIIKQQYKQK